MVIYKREVWAKTEDGVSIKVKNIMFGQEVTKVDSISMIKILDKQSARKKLIVSVNKKVFIGQLKLGQPYHDFKLVTELVDEKNIVIWKKKKIGRKSFRKKINDLKNA